MSNFENNLAKGNVAKQLIRFSLPFLLSNLIQTLYSVVDMIIVGKFSGAASMAGVNIGGQVTFIMTNIVVGLSTGGTVLIGQYMGAGKKEELKKTISTLFTGLFILALVITGVMTALRVPILDMLKTPTNAYSEASNYLVITILGTIFIFAYNALSAVMRGMGDSKRPLWFVAIACATNVVLDFILVAQLGMGARGAAIATIVSQAVSVILCIIYLRNSNFVFEFSRKSFKLYKDTVALLLKTGFPMAVQNCITGLSFLFLTALVNLHGENASAALGAIRNFNGFGVLPAIAMSSAISAMSAQNLGAKEYGRAKKTMYIGMVIAVAISAIVFVVSQIWPREIVSIFCDESEVINFGVQYLSSFKYEFMVIPFLFALNGLFIGAGHTTFSLINTIIGSLIIRIPITYVVGIVMQKGMFEMGFAMPAASGISLIIAIVYYISGKWKKEVILKN